MNLHAEDIPHWNIWFTDELLRIISSSPHEKIHELFRSYASFSRMDYLFSLKKNYLQCKRKKKWAHKPISINILESMKNSVRNNINKWKISYPSIFKELNEVETKLVGIINLYHKLFNPKQSSFSWIRKYHPDLNVSYFANIETHQQAYWLGFLIADGWITLIHKQNNNYYEIGFGQNKKDEERVFKFVKDLGLNRKYIRDKPIDCPIGRSNKKTKLSVITFYSGNVSDKRSMANDLIRLGMKYKYDLDNNRRKKTPELAILRNYNLMIAYLLGLYDGDGTLAYNKKDGRISPSIATSNKLFLIQIKEYFKIHNKIQKTKTCYKLNLEKEIFKQMMSINVDSMKRKRVSLEKLNKPKITKQRKWLISNFTEDDLKSLFRVISPSKASKLLGIHRETLVSFVKKYYNIEFPNKSYYNQLATYYQIHGKDAAHYSELMYWNKFLRKIGKYSNIGHQPEL